MSVDVTIGDTFYPNVATFQLSEDSTPIDPSDTTGGVGQISLTIAKHRDWRHMRKQTLDLEDSAQGTTQGRVEELVDSSEVIQITAISRLAQLTVVRTAQPYRGTLEGAFAYYLSLCGITEKYIVEESVRSIPVVLPGWSGEVWLQVNKKLAPAMGVEISLVSDLIVMRPLRGRLAENHRISKLSHTISDTGLAQSVEGYVYNSHWETDQVVYPTNGVRDPEAQILQVDAGERVEIDLPIEASLISVQQPRVVRDVGPEDAGASVYTVSGNDGLPITPSQWEDFGGSVSVEINEDTRSLKLIIVGARQEQYAPFRLAAASGPSDFYNSLQIVGTGVFFDKELVTIKTGLTVDQAATEVGATVDNEFFDTQAKLLDALVWTATRYTGPRETLTVTTSGIHRIGESGNYRFPIIADFNADLRDQGITTIAEWNALHPGQTVGEFDADRRTAAASDFANQAFGNVAGARVFYEDAYYRIRQSTIDVTDVQYTAEQDTTVGDFDAAWAGATVGEFNANRRGITVGMHNTEPLRRPDGPGYGDGQYGYDRYGD